MAAKAPPSLTNGTLPSPALPGYSAFIPETPGSSGKIPDHCNSEQGVVGAEEGGASFCGNKSPRSAASGWCKIVI